MTRGFAGVFEGSWSEKSPGLKPIDYMRLIQGAEAPCSLRKAKAELFVGERGGRFRSGGVHRGSSRSKDALRMTARTDNGKAEADSSAALRNDKQKEQATANAGILRYAQNDNAWGLRSG